MDVRRRATRGVQPRSARSMAVATVALLVLAGCGGGEPERSSAPGSSATPTSPETVAGPDYVDIPRTRISLRVPEGMELQPSLPGLGRPNSRTSVVVLVVPAKDKTPQAAMAEMAGGFTSQKAAEKGLEFGAAQDLEIAGFPAKVITGSQRAGAVTFAKVIAILAVDDSVVMMTGTIEPGDPLTVAELEDVLTAARWSDQVAEGDLGFDLTPAPGYERQSGSTMAMGFTLGGTSGEGAPSLLAAPSMGQERVGEDRRREFALNRFDALPAKPSADQTEEVQIAGRTGFEMIGRGSRAGEVVYAVVLYTEDGYVIVAGTFDPAKHPDQVPAFRAMAHSLVLG